MTLSLSADEVLATTRAVRRRLDFDRPVDDATLRECLELALQAPTGSLRQDWHFVVSTDPEQCRAVGTIYQEVWLGRIDDNYLAKAAAAETDPIPRADWVQMMDSARYLAETFPRTPAIFIPCIEGRLDGAPAGLQALRVTDSGICAR